MVDTCVIIFQSNKSFAHDYVVTDNHHIIKGGMASVVVVVCGGGGLSVCLHRRAAEQGTDRCLARKY